MDRNRIVVAARKLHLPTRRQFMKAAAAVSAGVFVAGAAGTFIWNSNRKVHAGGAGGSGAWCNTLSPGVTWCYNYDTHYSYQTRYGDLHTMENGGEAPWTLSADGFYHESTCENKYDATHMIYWDNFGFDLPLDPDVKLKALHVRLVAESFEDGGPSGARTQPKNGNQIKISKRVADNTWPRAGGWIDPGNDHGWQGTVQPFIKGGRNWKENLWTKSCDMGVTDPACDQHECCGPVTGYCPEGGDCYCDTEDLCDQYCSETLGYTTVQYWGKLDPTPPYSVGCITASELEDSRFGLSIQVVAKDDNQYFRVLTNPAPEIRVYW